MEEMVHTKARRHKEEGGEGGVTLSGGVIRLGFMRFRKGVFVLAILIVCNAEFVGGYGFGGGGIFKDV